MLDLQDRRLLLESLRPPDGYQLDRAVGTTFSLDLHALLTTPLAFTFFDIEDDEGNPSHDPLALLESVRRHASRISIFCQAAQIHVPKRQERLFAYLEKSVFEVVAPDREGIFHPKIWVLRFICEGAPVLYRILCLSRNLTFDRSWDTVLALEGRLLERSYAIAANHPLGDFIKDLPSLATRAVPRSVQESVDLIQDEIRRVQFDPPPGFSPDIRFWSLGLRKRRTLPFPDGNRPLLIVSPFLSDGLLQRATERRNGCVLITRTESADQIGRETLARFERVFVLSQEANPEERGEEVGGEEDTEVEGQGSLSGLHVKLYVIDDGWKARVWTGSANATEAAFGKNVEFLVELEGQKGDCGIKKLLEQVRGETNFADLLREYNPPDNPPEADPLQQELERRIKEVKRSFSEDGLYAEITPDDNSQEFDLVLRKPAGTLLTIPEGATLRCWPVTLPFGRAVQLLPDREIVANFNRVSIDALTSFYALRLTLTRTGKEASESFVVKLPLEGEPPDRLDRLIRALLKNKQQVLRLLVLLLADLDVLISGTAGSPSLGLGVDGGGGGDEFPLLESLLRALESDPRKLDRVHRLVTDLCKTSEGAGLLPEGFQHIWSPIWEVRKGLQA